VRRDSSLLLTSRRLQAYGQLPDLPGVRAADRLVVFSPRHAAGRHGQAAQGPTKPGAQTQAHENGRRERNGPGQKENSYQPLTRSVRIRHRESHDDQPLLAGGTLEVGRGYQHGLARRRRSHGRSDDFHCRRGAANRFSCHPEPRCPQRGGPGPVHHPRAFIDHYSRVGGQGLKLILEQGTQHLGTAAAGRNPTQAV
jgi:hypothetical protein